MRRALGVRGRLMLIVLVALGIGLAAATYGFNALVARTTSRDVDSLLRQRLESERVGLRIHNGHIRLTDGREDPLADAQLWIFDGPRLLEAPRARTETAAGAHSLAAGPARFLDVPVTDVRLYGAPVLDGQGRRVGTIVAGVSVAPYEQTKRAAVVASFLLAAVLLVFAGAITWWLLRSALRPVEVMTEQAAAWSEHDLDRRFGLGEPHDELTRLGATLDGLLDRLAASLRHERRFSAELSHELRTPLSKVIAEAELALRRQREPEEYRRALELVLGSARQVARVVEALVAAAQHDSAATRGISDAFAVASDVVEQSAHIAAAEGVRVAAQPPGVPLRIGVDADLAERILQPVVENACRYGRTRVDVAVVRHGSRVLFRVTDDGPGVEAAERESIFEPGRRGASAGAVAGAGLGLALARRLARATSGEVSADPSPDGGVFTVELPSA